MKRILVGYRVKTTDGRYVVQVGERLVAEPGKPKTMSKPEAYRRMAHWLERGYTPVLASVFRRG